MRLICILLEANTAEQKLQLQLLTRESMISPSALMMGHGRGQSTYSGEADDGWAPDEIKL